MDDDEDMEIVSCPMHLIDFLIVIASTANSIFEVIADGFEKVTYVLASHANWRNDQAIFQDEARRQIETLPTTEE